MKKSTMQALAAAGLLVGGYLYFSRTNTSQASTGAGALPSFPSSLNPYDWLAEAVQPIVKPIADTIAPPPAIAPASQPSAMPNIAQLVTEYTANILGSASSTANLAAYYANPPKVQSPQVISAISLGQLPWGKFGAFTPQPAVGTASPVNTIASASQPFLAMGPLSSKSSAAAATVKSLAAVATSSSAAKVTVSAPRYTGLSLPVGVRYTGI